MVAKIFIDGEHGTTGLQIRERLASRVDLTILSLAHEDRRDANKRATLLRQADIAILCLPDDAAREAVALTADAKTRFIDASTAHRTADDWVFGFAEAEPGQADRIAKARYVSNPGCYSTGAIGILRPLVLAGLLPADYPVTISAVSGYSGGGKGMIEQMEDTSHPDHIAAPYFVYALGLQHKHVPEIIKHSGLTRRPIFSPSVGRFAQGMAVQVPLHLDMLRDGTTVADVHAALASHYEGCRFVAVSGLDDTAKTARLDPAAMHGRDDMVIHVTGDPSTGTANIIALLDNLGKGASGAAVQNLNLMLG